MHPHLCVICGDTFWRVQRCTGLLKELVCWDCTQAIEAQHWAALYARNSQAPWFRAERDKGVQFHPDIEIVPNQSVRILQ